MIAAATPLSDQIAEARKAGDWERHAELWEQRRLAAVEQDEAILDDANDTLDALMQAEAFVAGFEGDPTQEGVADILAGLRLAVSREQAAPMLLDALKRLHRNGQRQGWNDGYEADMEAAEAAIAAAERR